MAKHTLKILRCERRKILKVCLTIFQHCEIKDKIAARSFIKTINLRSIKKLEKLQSLLLGYTISQKLRLNSSRIGRFYYFIE